VGLASYFIDGLAFATESWAGRLHGQGITTGLSRLLWVSGGASLGLGLLFAMSFFLFPIPLFGLLTDHVEILGRLPTFVPWLFPTLGFGSIAYMLDGYFLGLTQGRILRQSTLIAVLIGFSPIAIAAWYWHSSHLLWLALTGFMAARAITLGSQVSQSLRTF
ncbi:MAG TPA: MATE family efflux transporter, partial [Coleofasciculaceae cyanobacterium]